MDDQQEVYLYAGILHSLLMRFEPLLLRDYPIIASKVSELLKYAPESVQIEAGIWDAELSANTEGRL